MSKIWLSKPNLISKIEPDQNHLVGFQYRVLKFETELNRSIEKHIYYKILLKILILYTFPLGTVGFYFDFSFLISSIL